jgi:hypothetical protein
MVRLGHLTCAAVRCGSLAWLPVSWAGGGDSWGRPIRNLSGTAVTDRVDADCGNQCPARIDAQGGDLTIHDPSR